MAPSEFVLKTAPGTILPGQWREFFAAEALAAASESG
jgi:hypothetical protein